MFHRRTRSPQGPTVTALGKSVAEPPHAVPAVRRSTAKALEARGRPERTTNGAPSRIARQQKRGRTYSRQTMQHDKTARTYVCSCSSLGGITPEWARRHHEPSVFHSHLHHSASAVFRDRGNLNLYRSRLFRPSREEEQRASVCCMKRSDMPLHGTTTHALPPSPPTEPKTIFPS